MTCDKCGQPLEVGQWPFCPHPHITGDEYRSHYFQDEIPGGLVIENGVKEPVKVYSHSEARAIRARNGWELDDTFRPMPGTDVDPSGRQNPAAYIDRYTLEAAKVLLLRSAGVAVEEAPVGVLQMSPTRELTTAEARDTLLGSGEWEYCSDCLLALDFEGRPVCQVCGGSGYVEVKRG